MAATNLSPLPSMAYPAKLVSAFHDKAKAAKPNQPSKQSTFWVAVLHESKRPADADDADFLWIKCHGKITADAIKNQYIAHFKPNQEIYLRHDCAIIDPAKTMTDLNSFRDNIIAIEAIRKSDLLSRTTAPRREPLQPRLGPGSLNDVVPTEVPIKPESPYPTPRDENRPPLSYSAPASRPLIGIDSVGCEPLSQPSRSCHTAPQFNVEDFMKECALRDFVHERLEGLIPGLDVLDADVENRRAGLVAEWHGMPAHTQDMYKTRASYFVKAPVVADRYPAQLDQFIRENAGFYKFLFSRKPDHDRLCNQFGPDRAFLMMLDEWAKLNRHSRDTFVYEGQRLRHTASRSIEPSVYRASDVTSFSAGPDTSEHFETHVPQNFSLQKLFANSTPDLLEQAVEKGVQLLEGLKNLLTRTSSDDAAQWLQSIENIQKQAARARTVVGVVGNTGAGKSSVINAILDEERLVPTNCMRACTAVVTEISYNHTDDLYKAEIEFISRQDWEKELKILFQDLFDGSGNICREASNEETEAGVAYSKIKAVYPKYTKEMLQNSSVGELIRHVNVQNVLGQRREIVQSDSLLFYKQLQSFVDSKEKTTADKDKSKKQPKEMEFWPLIKVVRLYVKAPALSTGAVIVDLPGVHDSNAARSAVAEGYMKQCTGLWIVAPINRAVDDKAAKSLLGETFKRQLKMDGAFSTVTFICSKTDDISLMECQESLGLEEEMSALWAKSDMHADDKRKFKRQLDELKEAKEVYIANADEAEEQLEIWETLRDEIEDGKTVFAPHTTDHSVSKKRKRSSDKASSTRKRPQTVDSDLDSFQNENTEDPDAEESSDEEYELQTRGDPLTRQRVDEKLSELRIMKKDARRNKVDVEQKIKVIRKQISDIDAAEEKLHAEMSAICISGRNKYSRGAIQQDFAAGIKELDQELADEEDAANFNPDAEIRDYEEVARSLPVFCVSSRGYQKLQGRLRKDPAVPGFQTVEETEIPQLQAHCKKLTEAGREASCRRFLNSLSQLLNSLRLWSSNDGSGAQLTEGQKVREAQILQDRLRKLDTGLEKQIRNVCEHVRDEFQANIFDLFEDAISTAANEANKTALQWGAPINRSDRAAGGYFYATYKAICRRDGVFSNAQGPHDWNAELLEPVLKTISSGWEKTFSRRVSSILCGFPSKAASLMKSFHQDVETRASRNGGALSTLQMVSHQLYNYQELFKDLCNTSSATVIAQAKEINRMFQPVIADAVGPAYTACCEERGTGCYKRMKEHMTTHIDRTRWTMFPDSTNTVKQSLEDLMKSVEENMLAKADDVFLSMKRDYSSAIIGSHSATGRELPRDQRIMRNEVLKIITGSEKIFKRVVGLEPGEDEQDGVDQEPAVEPTNDTIATKPGSFDEEQPIGCSLVKMETDHGSSNNANGSPIPPKSESQEGEGSSYRFRQFKPEDKDQECMVDQQLGRELSADLSRILAVHSFADDQSIEDSADDESVIDCLDMKILSDHSDIGTTGTSDDSDIPSMGISDDSD